MDKKEFVDYILNNKEFDESNLPKKIYKFISLDNNEELNNKKITTLKNKQVYLSSPLDFNDPYDCLINMIIIESLDDLLKLGMNRKERRAVKKNKEIKSEIHEEAQNLQKNISNEWNGFRSRILVCCFTESWNNFLMWSHYANSYNGICIEYDMKKLLKSKKELLPVLYTDKLIATKDYLNKEDFRKDKSETFEKSGIYAMLSKHKGWSYENEWRLIEIEDTSTKGKQCILPTPTALFFGKNISEIRKSKIIKIAKELDIPKLYDVKISNTEYKLIKQKI